EAALGHHLQLVLTEQPEAAQQILVDLSAAKKGRASIAPLGIQQTVPAPETSTASDASDPSFVNAVPAASVVEADAAVQTLVHRLLGSTQVVPDLSAATAAW